MDSFNEASHVFLDWLKRSGAEISPKIELKDLRNFQSGRGVGEFAPC
jgi:SET domain-containing protein 6